MEIPPAPEPQRPPQVLDFVGRDEELAYYVEGAGSEPSGGGGGMPGVGKTALAVKLAEWVAPGRGLCLLALLSRERGPSRRCCTAPCRLFGLAWGRGDLRDLYQYARLTGRQPLPMESIVDYLAQFVGGRDSKSASTITTMWRTNLPWVTSSDGWSGPARLAVCRSSSPAGARRPLYGARSFCL